MRSETIAVITAAVIPEMIAFRKLLATDLEKPSSSLAKLGEMDSQE